MRPTDFDTFELGLEDAEAFADQEEREFTGHAAGACILLDHCKILTFGTPTDAQIAELLDLIGPFGPGEHLFESFCLLDGAPGDYSDFCSWLRREIRRAYTAGRVKADGQKRVRRPKPAPAQADLFGGAL